MYSLPLKHLWKSFSCSSFFHTFSFHSFLFYRKKRVVEAGGARPGVRKRTRNLLLARGHRKRRKLSHKTTNKNFLSLERRLMVSQLCTIFFLNCELWKNCSSTFLSVKPLNKEVLALLFYQKLAEVFLQFSTITPGRNTC